ncbi:hypothetical protein LINPERPRIM_LOCUS8732 [Linum perenne]
MNATATLSSYSMSLDSPRGYFHSRTLRNAGVSRRQGTSG